MDQPEEVLEKLERFNVQKNPEITRELDEYVSFVARTGESVFNWALVKRLYREKLINVITEFNEAASAKELPVYPNVDPFNYETMKKMLIERLDSFNAAPFTIQRISELLADPRKQYSRIDKFMRAVEKNILVVSTVSPGRNRSEESENGDSLDSVGLNGDFSSDVNVDIEMENDTEGSFNMTKEFNATTHRKEANHDIVTTTHDAVTIKKIGSKEEESSTPAVAVNVATGEPLQPTQTDVTIESQSTVTITVCEPTENVEPSVSNEEAEQNKSSEVVEESDQKLKNDEKSEEGVIKTSTELITPIVSEPKIDEDALLNEPLRPADDEILVDTSQTTPLAALENIVANRTVIDEVPRVEEQQQKSEQSSDQSPMNEQEEETEKVEVAIKEDAVDGEGIDDDSKYVAKRLKLDAENEEPVESSPKKEASEGEKITENLPQEAQDTVSSSSTNIAPIVETPTEEQPLITEQQPESAPIEQETPAVENDALPSQPSVIEAIQTETSVAEEDTVQPIITEVEKPIEQQQQESAVIENQLEDEMEAAPIVENSMALDEDVNASPVTSTDMSVANNMDTDNNETENALMDVDDDEPMDQ